MDKNIAAILRTDTTTVGVVFHGGAAKEYTYITDLKFEIGDLALVCVSHEFKVVTISRVDNDLRIEPNSDVQYKWIASKVDLSHYNDNIERNTEIERTLAKSYQKAMRSSMAASVLSALPDDARAELTALLE